jgi:PAS domain S-box-containing protein
VGSIFRAALDALIVMDADGIVRDWNPAAEQIFGYSRDDAVGVRLEELIIPGPLRVAHRNALARYVETGESTILDRRVELSAVDKQGGEFPVELAVTELTGANPPLFGGFIRDLRERAQTRRENLRLQQRMAFLAQAGLVLESSLEFEETLHRMAELTVPELAQLAVVDVLEEGGEIRTAVAAAEDPAQARAVERMRREYPLQLDGPHPVAEVLCTGRPALLAQMSRDFQREIAAGPEHFQLMRSVGYRSAVVVPLVARQRVLGTLSLLRFDDSEPYEPPDLVLAEELARRAALAVDNARLFEATQALARTLQQSLLPRELPAIPGVRITGRYRAAAEGQEVGGDFYDVFTIGEGTWGIAIGDVCGKGPEAAALTSLARYTLRALAGRDPASVLRQLNESVLRDSASLPERLFTVLFAGMWIQGEELMIRVATAGHPPPLVLRASGRVERLDLAGPLVGLTAAPEYRTAQVALASGDAVLLYTDGLTDARAPERILDEGMLVELLEASAGLRGDELADLLERDATGGENPRDDIAVLILERSGEPGILSASPAEVLEAGAV